MPFAPTFLFLGLTDRVQTNLYRPDPLPACVSHSSTKPLGFHASAALLGEAGVKERGAVLVDGHCPGLFEVILVVRSAREDGDRAYAGGAGSLDVPDRVPYGDGLIRRGSGPSEGLLEDIGGRLRVLDGAGVDDAVDIALRFELLHVMFQLLVLGAGDEPDLVAPLFEGGDQLLR